MVSISVNAKLKSMVLDFKFYWKSEAFSRNKTADVSGLVDSDFAIS
jgi:hypothetical protein